ncbi:MAG: ABC transporter substrate binding protein [Lachnospiraceae bacterium]
MKKKILAAVLTTAMFTALAAGSAFAQEENYTIGISQFAEHGSLDNCGDGFLEGLKEAGIEEGVNLEVTYQNAQADTGTASRFEQALFPKEWI